MVANYDETLIALRRFIRENAPEGISPRMLEDIEHQTSFFNLEFRRDNLSCTLYIEVDSFAGDSVLDERGDRYRTCKFVARPSWPSYGSVDVQDTSRFIRLLTDVNVFADKLLGAFHQPIVKLIETAEQADARKRKAAEDRTRLDVQAMMRANHKGMRVGTERVARVQPGQPDLLPLGEVTCCVGDRHYTAHVTATRTFRFMRTT